ncbi:nicotinamide mononucleotide adenylyltransferase [Sphingobacterium sp. DK4209]|uniref:Nicotinamide mononucleotide adenylyltransferase n=1 Tax=Sphingobacterium zhuxiongii TaxID=2662364 RepID=A0A5Q0QCA6_9SPHI|nr:MULTISPECIES: nicotinamide mononucleotide adenylyltransferase [unclassified Sphingobacterium]MVZ65805.1 nicotinamide mononucleotide adenylyltransferase [Sphingobacterium sp. DK4209]QGA24850.1 nicotinamide mononucleotide adenylyltransferase [Sphingobacterium sp. dk4302]
MAREIYETKRKALKINLNPDIYGTFAEIGAGQEVARNFFEAGAASGTIAKTISAYDMAFSDAIYGVEESGRYVSRTRLNKMLDHEFDLLKERLQGEKYDSKKFFAFADTVTTLNFTKSNEPHGWIGIRFQHEVDGPTNDIVIHVRLLDSDNRLQTKVLGILGVNLVFAAYYYAENPQTMIESLVDNLSIGSVEIDLVKVSGPIFEKANERLLNLYLIAKGFAKAAIFKPDAKAAQIKDYLYKKNIIILRTKYRQKSNPNFDLFNLAVEEFRKNTGATAENTVVLIEVLMGNVLDENSNITDEDLNYFAERAEYLCSTGNNILVSNFRRNNHLAEFVQSFKPRHVGIATNVFNLKNIFNTHNYNKENYTNELLSYISGMFSKNVKLYAYPYLDKKKEQIVTTKNMPVSEEAKPLFDFLIQNKYIIDIENYDEKFVKEI